MSNRLANKVNAVGVLRSVQQLGIDTYATMLTTRIDSHYVIESQYAIDSLFKTICLQL